MNHRKAPSHRVRAGEDHRFSAEGDFIERLEGAERKEHIPVEDIVPRLGLRNDDTVVDLGAGIGYFTFPLAKQAREVIAVDLEPRMLEVLSTRLKERGVGNVRALRGEATHLPLADSSVGQVLAAFIYHEVGSQMRLIRECARVLRKHGTLTVIDFQKRDTPFGPPLEERKEPEDVLRTSKKHFSLVSRFDTPVFYQLILTRN